MHRGNTELDKLSVTSDEFLHGRDKPELLLDATLEKLEQQELFACLLRISKERQHDLLYLALIAIRHIDLANTGKQTSKVLGSRLERVEELLVQLQLPPRSTIKRMIRKGVISSDQHRVALLYCRRSLALTQQSTLVFGLYEFLDTDLVLD